MLLHRLIHWLLAASMLCQFPAYAGVMAAGPPEASTPTVAPSQSTDPIFDTVDLPHDPALAPSWGGANLTANHPDAYHADFTLDGVSLFGLAGSDPLSESARFLLTALRQGGTQTTLPAPDPMSGNPDAVNGWLVQDNVLLRARQSNLVEIASPRADGVELAYLLAAPTGGIVGRLGRGCKRSHDAVDAFAPRPNIFSIGRRAAHRIGRPSPFTAPYQPMVSLLLGLVVVY